MNSALPAVDIHTHLAPQLSAQTRERCGVESADDGRYTIDGHLIGPPGLYDPKQLVDYLDAHDLDQAFVSVPPPFYRQQLTGEARRIWVSLINLGIRDACRTDERLKPLVHLPLEDPLLALEVVRKHLVVDDIAGWAAAAGGGSCNLAEASLAELWQLLEADGRPLILHPGASPDPRLQNFYLHNLTGNPVETGVAVGQLVFGRVLDKHPDLRIVLVHCGGVVPSLAGRWQQGIDTARPGIDTSMRPVSVNLRQLYTDCLTHDPVNVDIARRVFGDTKLLLGSDWPFPMGLDDPRSSIQHLDSHLQDAIARSNVRALTAIEHTISRTQEAFPR